MRLKGAKLNAVLYCACQNIALLAERDEEMSESSRLDVEEALAILERVRKREALRWSYDEPEF